MHRRPGGVAQRVGQALAHHAVDGLDRGGGQPLARALQAQGHVEARSRPRARPAPRRGRGRARGRSRRRRPAAPRAGSCRCSAWRAAPAIASNVSPVSSGSTAAIRWPAPGLHDHHADRVGDDVVQLGGDPRALVADRERGELPRARARAPRRARRAGRRRGRARGSRGRRSRRCRRAGCDGTTQPSALSATDRGREDRRQQRDRGGHRHRRHRSSGRRRTRWRRRGWRAPAVRSPLGTERSGRDHRERRGAPPGARGRARARRRAPRPRRTRAGP